MGVKGFSVPHRLSNHTVDRMEEMLGSYAPGQIHEKKFPLEEAPHGMMARGSYQARSKFTDDDRHSYLDFEWSFEVYTKPISLLIK
jgi:hypothetical protein